MLVTPVLQFIFNRLFYHLQAAKYLAQIIVVGGQVVARAFTKALRQEIQGKTITSRSHASSVHTVKAPVFGTLNSAISNFQS